MEITCLLSLTFSRLLSELTSCPCALSARRVEAARSRPRPSSTLVVVVFTGEFLLE